MIPKTLRILFALIILAAFSVDAQQIVKARRGDSWASIAAKYGIDPEDLRQANNNVPECFIGMEVVIPDDLIQEAKERMRREQEEAINSFINNQLDIAEQQIAMGKLKDAKKTYDKLIKSHPSTHLYFLRGLVKYDMHKWGSAMDDFSYVRSQNDCDEEMRADANAFYAQAAKYKEESDREKSELIGTLFAAALTTAVVTTAAIEQNKQQKAMQKQMASASGSTQTRERSTSSSRVKSRNTGTSRSASTNGHRSRSSSSSSSASSMAVMSNSEWEKKIQADYQKYFSPEAFVSNYMNGLPTLPTSQEMGLTGIDAYAYDLQANLQYRQQLTDLAIAQQTERQIREGQEKAMEEIRNFSSIYGREPTPDEIEAIYKKHTQVYIDSYNTYVQETVATDKELGLGEITRTEVHKRTSNGSAATSSSTKSSDESRKAAEEKRKKQEEQKALEEKKKDEKSAAKKEKEEKKKKEKEEKKKEEEKKKDENNASYHGTLERSLVTVYDSATKTHICTSGKLYKKGATYYLEMDHTFYRVEKSNRREYNYMVMKGSKYYYFY